MAKYQVCWVVTKYYGGIIEAQDFDEAQAKWEEEGHDGELSFIEDEEGNQLIFD